MNLYRYTFNSPVNYIDSDGKAAWEILPAILHANDIYTYKSYGKYFDKVKHCYVSCVGASTNDPMPNILNAFITNSLGLLHEKLSPGEDSEADIQANRKGIGYGISCPSTFGFPNKKCKNFCEEEYPK